MGQLMNDIVRLVKNHYRNKTKHLMTTGKCWEPHLNEEETRNVDRRWQHSATYLGRTTHLIGFGYTTTCPLSPNDEEDHPTTCPAIRDSE